jgi:hypothetical protein
MAKWPIVRVTEEQHKVFLITCAETGEQFEHEQVTRGRPPVYSPAGKVARDARLAAERASAPRAPRGRKPAVLRAEVAEDETPAPGDVVMRLTTGMKRENALRWLVPARLISVDGETATVERNGETLTTKFANLVKLNLG